MIKFEKKNIIFKKEKKNQENSGKPSKLVQRSQIRSPLNLRSGLIKNLNS